MIELAGNERLELPSRIQSLPVQPPGKILEKFLILHKGYRIQSDENLIIRSFTNNFVNNDYEMDTVLPCYN